MLEQEAADLTRLLLTAGGQITRMVPAGEAHASLGVAKDEELLHRVSPDQMLYSGAAHTVTSGCS